jgi:hypothetical protein
MPLPLPHLAAAAALLLIVPYEATAAASIASIASLTNLCTNGTVATCGKSPSFCAEACVWNSSHCVQHDGYPLPANDSLVALGAVGSPLVQNNLNIFFYGDSITWLNKYEPLIENAIKTGPGSEHCALRTHRPSRCRSSCPWLGSPLGLTAVCATPPASKLANISIVNQGENGGTVKDLVSGISPWGRLDFRWPQHPLNFTGSLNGMSTYGKPDIAGIMIGINDNLQGQVYPGTCAVALLSCRSQPHTPPHTRRYLFSHHALCARVCDNCSGYRSRGQSRPWL